ncbi:unnamed protein product, partial [Candidula unifasciata]
SGQPCGRAHHHCLSTARCYRRKAVCHCDAPLYGNGQIGCFRHGDAVALLQLDPNLRTFNNDYLSIATPCRYKVVHYSMGTSNGTRASAEVYAKNGLTPKGEYYVKNVLVVISVMTHSKVGKHSVLLEGNATDGNYTFVTTEMEDSMTETSLKQHLDFTPFFISVTVDEVDNFITARAEGVGLTVRFRPAAIGQDDQKMRPGVTMVVDKEVLHAVKFLNGTLSSSPHGVRASEQAKQLGLDVQMYTSSLAILSTPALIMDDPTCQDATVVYKNICTAADRVRLLPTCTSLYSDKDFVSCIRAKWMENREVAGHTLLFRYCLQAFCLGLVNVCEVMVERIRGAQCPLPAALQNFQCSLENLRGN